MRGGAGGMVADPNQPKSLRGGRTTSMMNMTDLSLGGGGSIVGGGQSSPGIFHRFMGAGAAPQAGASVAMHSSKL